LILPGEAFLLPYSGTHQREPHLVEAPLVEVSTLLASSIVETMDLGMEPRQCGPNPVSAEALFR